MYPTGRPYVFLRDGKVYHSNTGDTNNAEPARVVLGQNCISVGCSDIHPDAAKFILEKHKELFDIPEKPVILQTGIKQ